MRPSGPLISEKELHSTVNERNSLLTLIRFVESIENAAENLYECEFLSFQ